MFSAHDDCLNSVIFVEEGQNEFLLSSSGQRTFGLNNLKEESSEDSSDSNFEESKEIPTKTIASPPKNNCIKLWQI